MSTAPSCGWSVCRECRFSRCASWRPRSAGGCASYRASSTTARSPHTSAAPTSSRCPIARSTSRASSTRRSHSASRSWSAPSAAWARSRTRAQRGRSRRTRRWNWRRPSNSCWTSPMSAGAWRQRPRRQLRAATRGTRSRSRRRRSTVRCSMATLLDDLNELLRIPSVSAGRPNPEGIRQAAEWVRDRVLRAGGQAELLGERNPIVYGELKANRDGAPDVIVYGHYDAQDVGPADEWESDPFEPTARDGRLYARGSSDDKGNFLPVLHAACTMHEAGELPVNVRVVIEGEEEVGSQQLMQWIAADERGADAV